MSQMYRYSTFIKNFFKMSHPLGTWAVSIDGADVIHWFSTIVLYSQWLWHRKRRLGMSIWWVQDTGPAPHITCPTSQYWQCREGSRRQSLHSWCWRSFFWIDGGFDEGSELFCVTILELIQLPPAKAQEIFYVHDISPGDFGILPKVMLDSG